MPLGDIAGEALGGVFRFIGRLLIELVLELMLKGTGATILRILRPKTEPGDTASILVGLLFWAVMVVLAIVVYQLAVPAG